MTYAASSLKQTSAKDLGEFRNSVFLHRARGKGRDVEGTQMSGTDVQPLGAAGTYNRGCVSC